MKIYPLELIEKDGLIFLQYQVQLLDSNRTLWYAIDKQYQHFTTELLDAPLVALMIPAMSVGEDISVQGTISERLFYNLNGPYQAVLQLVIPSLKNIRVYTEDVHSASTRAPGVAAGFSCGIDSFSLLKDHYYASVTDGFKLTHLTFNNVGSHGPEAGAERLFEARYEGVKRVAEQIGLPVVKVNSNLDSFYPGFIFERSYTPRNASVALLLQNGIGRFLYASSRSYQGIFSRPSINIADTDPIALPLLSTEIVEIIATGSQYTRVEKTICVGTLPVSYDHLDVCVHPLPNGRNCSRCIKCLAAELTLEMVGLLQNYENSFDLSVYVKEREKYIGKVLAEAANSSYRSEIKSWIREKHYPIPLKSYFFAFQYIVHNNFEKFLWLIKGILHRLQKIFTSKK